ncbi:trypsin-like peptidase domain-containing protein [Candidatus Saccharibacteria bacterium]|nr:trypsin-like peptidase domain-containing protein [Candidatus Saccharibacteria bacterium]MBH1972979.1 trypsin-like peptidase domain-containing protein [Candidatus Saccharibacteria bacterium]MBH1991182.1 trypsin-like peptidase domain-containing protein [Candidatus Saccharibacteria bacterium]
MKREPEISEKSSQPTTSIDETKTQSAQPVPSAPATSVSRKRPSKGKFFAAAILLIVLCFTAGLGGGYISQLAGNNTPDSNRNSAGDGNQIITQEEEDISSVAAKVGPSVVSIVTKAQAQSIYGTRTQEGAGTGIIVSADGYVLTNKHVIQDSQEVAVVTSDGVTHSDVTVVGSDPLNDIAFLKIKGVNDLKPAELGDSSSIRIGQKVVAIGNSLGQYQNTVTSGIISGTGRPVSAQSGGSVETLTDLLQTDAAINPGNSGGPLTNLKGQVIGINTAVAQDAQGIGFSIPINATKGMLKQLLKTGKVERSYIGVNYISITPDVAEAYKLPVKAGAYVYSEQGTAIASGSPAEKAGIKDKDIITKVNDIEVGDRGGVASLVAEYAPGDTVKLTILRDNKTITLDVVLAAYSQS